MQLAVNRFGGKWTVRVRYYKDGMRARRFTHRLFLILLIVVFLCAIDNCLVTAKEWHTPAVHFLAVEHDGSKTEPSTHNGNARQTLATDTWVY